MQACVCCTDAQEHDRWHALDAADTLLLLDGKQLLCEAEQEVRQSCRPLPDGVTVAEAAAVMADVLQLESKHAAVKVRLPTSHSAGACASQKTCTVLNILQASASLSPFAVTSWS